MKIIFSIIVLSLFFLFDTFAQNDNCFEVDRISEIKIAPSNKAKLIDQVIDEITFRVIEGRDAKVLRNRFTKLATNFSDSLSQKQLELIEQATQKFRIAHLANHTDTTVSIFTFVNYFYVIQEAKDQNGVWRPIEVINEYVDCGTGVFHRTELRPHEYIEIYIRRYCGEFHTKLRIKLLTWDQILISEEFDGFINPEQFDLSKLNNSTTNRFHFLDHALEDELIRIKNLTNSGK
jgi:hypothetical protein